MFCISSYAAICSAFFSYGVIRAAAVSLLGVISVDSVLLSTSVFSKTISNAPAPTVTVVLNTVHMIQPRRYLKKSAPERYDISPVRGA